MFDLDTCYHFFKTEPDTAYFWSGLGPEGANIAEKVATQNGGVTLEILMETHKNELIEAGFEYDETLGGFAFSEENAGDWSAISKAYAQQASGDVHTVLGEKIREGSVWKKQEYPALIENEEVSSIIAVDPKTGFNKEELFSRERLTRDDKQSNESTTMPALDEYSFTEAPLVTPTQVAITSSAYANNSKSGNASNTLSAPAAQQRGEPETRRIDVGEITISPFEFDSIVELKIEKRLNAHSTLHARGVVKADTNFESLTKIVEDVEIKCKNGDRVYFCGVLKNIKLTCVGSVYNLEIYAISNTVLLDTQKHKRSFQNNAQNYESIVKTIIKDKNGAVTYSAPTTMVKNIILQYNETDWEFAKRLASHTNDVLIPKTDDNPAFYFGVSGSVGAAIKNNDYSISKNIERLRHMETEDNLLTEDNITVYTVETDEFVCDLGDKVKLNKIETDLYVCHLLLSFTNASLVLVYKLCAKEAVSAPKAYNRDIIGLTLDGKVLKVEKDKLKLHLGIDDKQDEGTAHLFKYATRYSTEGHTGWYIMPEKGDTVQLLFPAEDEKDAYAASSIRQEDTDRTSDPLVKYWRTTFGKEIKMDDKEILITSEDDKTYIRINMDSGIDIITPKPIKISSGDNIGISSKKDINISAGGKLLASANKNMKLSSSGSSIKMDGSIKMDAGEIIEN